MLLPWAGTSVIGHLIQQWANLGAAQIAPVCAADDEQMAAELDRLHVPREDRIYNPAPERGMFSSIQTAAVWSGWRPLLTHWAVVLGDQPHLHAATLERLLGFSVVNAAKICQPSRASRPRHPVVMPKPVFLALGPSGASTLKEFLAGYDLALCETEDPAFDLDIDRPDDYDRALRLERDNE